MEKTTCIVVGAGPAGSACALSLARKGIDTVLLERGRTPGEKNVSSFVLFMNELKRLVPDWEKDLPVERNIIRTDQAIFTGNDIKMITSYNYDKIDDPITFTAFRRKFDAWFAKKATPRHWCGACPPYNGWIDIFSPLFHNRLCLPR